VTLSFFPSFSYIIIFITIKNSNIIFFRTYEYELHKLIWKISWKNVTQPMHTAHGTAIIKSNNFLYIEREMQTLDLCFIKSRKLMSSR